MNIKNNKLKLLKLAWEFEPWDYEYNLEIFKETLIQTRDYIRDKGTEEDKSRLERVRQMDKAIWALEQIIDDNFYEIAQSRHPEIKDLKQLYEKEDKIQEEILNKAFDTIKNNILGWWD